MERPFERAASSRLEMGRLSRLNTGSGSTSLRLLRFGLREGAAPYGFFVDCINLDWDAASKLFIAAGRLPAKVRNHIGGHGHRRALASDRMSVMDSNSGFPNTAGIRSSRNRNKCARTPIPRPPSLLSGTTASAATCQASATYANPGFIVAAVFSPRGVSNENSRSG